MQAEPAALLKKETLAQLFSCELCEIFKNTYVTELLLYRSVNYTKETLVLMFSYILHNSRPWSGCSRISNLYEIL